MPEMRAGPRREQTRSSARGTKMRAGPGWELHSYAMNQNASGAWLGVNTSERVPWSQIENVWERKSLWRDIPQSRVHPRVDASVRSNQGSPRFTMRAGALVHVDYYVRLRGGESSLAGADPPGASERGEAALGERENPHGHAQIPSTRSFCG